MSLDSRVASHRIWRSLAFVSCFALLGCEPVVRDEDDVAPDYGKVVTVKGVVKIKGKTVPGVVVTFLPPRWAASNGETAADGSYTLQTAGQTGALPGDYKVAFSYLVSADGEPQGLASRSAISPDVSSAYWQAIHKPSPP